MSVQGTRYAPSGPGSELKKTLASLGFQEREDCDCVKYANAMDLHGPEWCEANIPTILKWLKKSAKARKVPQFLVGLAGKKLVRSAIQAHLENIDQGAHRATFQEVYCVNLQRRQDRWKEFTEGLPRDWPFRPVTRSPAIDGKKVPHPPWWRQGGGAWGCYRSHLRILEDCLNRGVNSVLLMEDDAIFPEDFLEKWKAFSQELPEDWGMVYLGGQHLYQDAHPPLKVHPEVYIPWNVNRTHAFALRGKTMREVYRHLSTLDWNNGHHVDHHLGRFVQRRDGKFPVYCPRHWLVGQREGRSNIAGRDVPTRFWMNAEIISGVDPATLPFVAVLGLHSSGSSALAGTLWGLGLHLGNTLRGFYGSTPGDACGYEAEGLMSLCESAIPFPATELAIKRGQLWGQLRSWITQRKKEAHQRKTLAAGKYPQLCRMGPQLQSICGAHLRVLVADRPLEESIQSIIRRQPKADPEKLEAHQRWLWEGREQLLGQLQESQVLRVEYSDLLAEPETQVERIVEWLSLDLDDMDARKARAVETVQPNKRHVFT